MDNRPVMIDLQNVKKKYVIRHNFEKPTTFSGKLKLLAKRIAHPTKKHETEDFYALNGVTFQVRKGEKVGIIGKNGAGKSTLLKVLSRITEPSDGRIEMLGKLSAMLEVGTGFNGELTGRENIYLNGAILGMTKEEIDSKLDAIIEFSEVGRFIDTPVKRYSSGMFVRLAFAVASNLDPDILIVDEVLAVGDTKFQRKCIDKMMNIADSGKTILYVSHQMQTIQQLCDRVIVLKEGKVVYDGDVEKGIEIYTETVDVDATSFDLTDHKPRGSQMAVIEKVDIIDKKTCSWFYNEPIRFKIKIKAKEKCDKVKLYFIIRDLNVNNVFGKSESAEINFSQAGKTYEIECSVGTTNLLAPGKYIAGLELWRDDEGIVTIHDIVPEVFSFEILGEDTENHTVPPLAWDTKIFGHMMADETQCNIINIE
ncbi:MAG: ABC transporter ATP-binding protein [Clostridia bacterium]|nr:ABC transporter ATP-binding protein [Clostridia bacterium]